MTVEKLIKELQQFPKETKVVIVGYEGGYNEVTSVKFIKLKLWVNSDREWWYGSHDIPPYYKNGQEYNNWDEEAIRIS